MPKKPHVSPSQMDTYFRCGEQWRRRYVLKDIIPPGFAMIKGRAVHTGAEVNYRQKVESHEDLDQEAIVAAAIDGFEATCAQDGYELSPDEKAIGASKVVGKAKDSTARMTRTFAKFISPTVRPVRVEEFVRIELPNSSHDLLGRLDVVDEDRFIRDLKTSGRRKSQSDIDASDQLTFYYAAHGKLTGERPAGVKMDVVVDLKSGCVAQSLQSTRDGKDPEVLTTKINMFIHGITSETYLPAAPGAWICSPKFCGYWHTCPFVNSERLAAAHG